MLDPDATIAAACFKLAGEWDFTRRDELQAILRPAESLDRVLLDFSEATFIDASVLRCLMSLRRRMLQRNRLSHIRITAASRVVHRLLEICELQELFGLRSPTVGAATSSRFAELPLIGGSTFMTA
jgi:anti-anti-sigma factor